MGSNNNMNRAKRVKNDEFYTRRIDIENELQHYPNAFRGKVVYCNCDDPRESEFFRFFTDNFEALGLKKLITCCYKNAGGDLFSKKDSERAVCLEYTGDTDGVKGASPEETKYRLLKGDGDFRSEESIALLKQADIVVSNPPFSLFREYISQLIEYGKQFVVVGSYNAVVYNVILEEMQSGRMWLGASRAKEFVKPDGSSQKFGNIAWFTNIAHRGESKRVQPNQLFKDGAYPKYDNFDAIECPTLAEIPVDYDGMIGVPVTYLEKANNHDFDVVGAAQTLTKKKCFYLDGRRMPARFVIRRRQPASPTELAAAAYRRENPPPKKTAKDKLKASLIKMYGRVCQCCYEEKTNNTDIQLDRIDPGANGGEYIAGNVGLLCARCNIKKGAREISYADLRAEGRAKGWIANNI